MTTYFSETVVCGACGRAFRHDAVGSTNCFGACDLDTRPPEMARSTLHTHVQRCPSCGYCAADATVFDERYRPVIASEDYQKQLHAAECPELASAFGCAGMLSESVGINQEAAWLFLRAAWVCDDQNLTEQARHWRNRAADLFVQVIGRGESLGNQAGAAEAVLVDCLRRAGRADKALELIGYAEQSECDSMIQEILAFQRTLLQRGDTACHTVAEAIH